ncbi:DoxX family protein [Sphingomonas sp. BN140010]|uniref:DoxX family protein n=1 Tax=Sphingomonas arvum TaxID=2992113 RepID=A0ABT3JBP9_9SPHN|nr:DoxX family protein [Sphingomonas sp. BN140010]MCW3796490.1 DoxX family protein [Sphingomonas sp. BN140010]
MSKLDRYAPQAIAALRIITSLLMIEHATMKFFAFPAAMPMPGPLPPIIVAAGVIEIVTGTLILLGLFTRPAAFLASGTMAAAYFLGHATQGFWPALNQGEPAIMFCFAFFVLIFTGPGAWSLDSLRRNRTAA